MSGKTANDFTKPVDYVVIAADGSTANYRVRALVSKIVSISGYADTLNPFGAAYKAAGRSREAATTPETSPSTALCACCSDSPMPRTVPTKPMAGMAQAT